MRGHHWEIHETPAGPTLFVDGRVVGSPGLPPPPGWLQRAYGIVLGREYARVRYRGFAGQRPSGADDGCRSHPVLGGSCNPKEALETELDNRRRIMRGLPPGFAPGSSEVAGCPEKWPAISAEADRLLPEWEAWVRPQGDPLPWQVEPCPPGEQICGIMESGGHLCCPSGDPQPANDAFTFYEGLARAAVLAGEIPLPVVGSPGDDRRSFWPPVQDCPNTWEFAGFLDGTVACVPPEPVGIPGEAGDSLLFLGRTDGLLGLIRNPQTPLAGVYFQGRQEGRALAEALGYQPIAPCPEHDDGWAVSAEIIRNAQVTLGA